MPNPFSYIKDEREVREKRLKEEKEREALQAKIKEEARLKEEKEKEQAFNDLIMKYDEAVTSLLVQLRDAAYPNQHVGRVKAVWRIYSEWEVTSQYVGYGVPTYTSTETKILLSIELEFDKNYNPKRFKCRREEKEVYAGLSGDDLTKALVKLHPSGQM